MFVGQINMWSIYGTKCSMVGDRWPEGGSLERLTCAVYTVLNTVWRAKRAKILAGSVVKITDYEYEECVIMFHVELHPPST